MEGKSVANDIGARVRIWSAALTESAWLAALVVVPLVVNLQSRRAFEADKVALLRSIAVLLAAVLAIEALATGGRARSEALRSLRRTPVVAGVLALACAHLIASVFSIAPRISLLGSYERAHGAYTWAACVTVFIALLLRARTRGQTDRVVTTLVLASFSAALYGVMQRTGYDPVVWSSDHDGRIDGTLGNPTFLGGFLAMVVPITIARLYQHPGSIRPTTEGGGTGSARVWLWRGAYALALLVQLLAAFYTRSRGPLIGMGVGVICTLLLLPSGSSARWMSRLGLGLVGAATLLLVLANLPHTPYPALRQIASLGRVGGVEVEVGSGRVRTVLWEGTARLIAASPLRALIGYGPDTLALAFNAVYSPELLDLEESRIPDRAHNEILDTVAVLGLLGLGASLFVLCAVFIVMLSALGVIDGPRMRRSFVLATLLGGVAGASLPYVLDGAFTFSGVGAAAGMVMALVGYLLPRSRTPPDQRPAIPARDEIMLCGLLGALVAHFVETQVGVATVTTRLCFWVVAALAVLLAGRPVNDSESEQGESTGAPPAAIASLALVVLTFDFYRPNLSLRDLTVLFVLAAATWALAIALFAAESTAGATTRRRIATRGGAVLIPWLLFALVYVPWLHWRPGAVDLKAVEAYGHHVAHAATILYLGILTVILLCAFATRRQPSFDPSPRSWNRGRTAAAVAIGIVAIGIIFSTNLNASRADVFSKQALSYEQEGEWQRALVTHEAALRLQPWQDYYATEVGRVELQLATLAPEQQRRGHLERAVAAMERARQLNPSNSEHARNLARVHRLWGQAASDPREGSWHLQQAERGYEAATALDPNKPLLWNEWARLAAETGDTPTALSRLERSLALHDRLPQTYELRARVLAEHGRERRALRDYAHAVELAPKDVQLRSRFALFCQRIGQLDRALAEVKTALALASDRDKASLEELATSLRNQVERGRSP
jgi:tetratricopeptide (TPR) repeat protein